jgi:asparagine synthase (glutamine-hydrolysing)
MLDWYNQQPYAIRHSPPAISDSELILHAYLHWGEECVQHLLGDWTFAMWDPRWRKLFAARDQCGISSFYYYRGPRFFTFALSIKALLALPQIPKRPNMSSIARYLAVEQNGGAQPNIQTVYEEILHLRPAHALTVTAEKADVRQYWFLENTPSLRLGSDDEYLEAFLELHTEAVRCRLRSITPVYGGGERGVGDRCQVF